MNPTSSTQNGAQPQNDVALMRSAAGMSATPPSQGSTGSNDIMAQLDSYASQNSPLAAPSSLSDKIGSDFSSMPDTIASQADKVTQDVANAGGGLGANIAGAGEMLGNVGSDVSGTVINAGLQAGMALVNKLNGDNGETLARGTQQALDATNVFGQKNSETLATIGNWIKNIGVDNIPDNVKNQLGGLLNSLGLMGGGKILNSSVEDLAKIPGKIIDTAGNVGNTIVDTVGAAKDKIAGSVADATQANIDAVNPDLSGKKLVSAYKQVVTGGRTATPASMFNEAGL